jgi:hypothetical protein
LKANVQIFVEMLNRLSELKAKGIDRNCFQAFCSSVIAAAKALLSLGLIPPSAASFFYHRLLRLLGLWSHRLRKILQNLRLERQRIGAAILGY